MEFIEYFEDNRKEHWKQEIVKADWRAAKYLWRLLNDATEFNNYFGEGGKVFLLVDGNKLVSFLTLSLRDCIPDDSMFPWVGFVYTYPDYRGNRYSEKLINYAEEQAGKSGYTKVYLTTDHINLYEKYGFTYLETRMDCWNEASKIYYKNV